jgi:MFS family permease
VPLLVAPCSEAWGRLPVYHIGNVLFIVFTVTCAVSGKLNMLIGFRFLQGVAGPTPITIGDGTIADLFVQEHRGGALAVWSMGPADRPVVGPITVAIDFIVDRE